MSPKSFICLLYVLFSHILGNLSGTSVYLAFSKYTQTFAHVDLYKYLVTITILATNGLSIQCT